jgi:aminocarboxymuconate-semialdehyde decarboxylase
MTSSQPAIDLHAHALAPAVEVLVEHEPERQRQREQEARSTSAASAAHNRSLAPDYAKKFADLSLRLRAMDEMGIDVQAVSVPPTQYYYWAGRDLATAIVRAANEHIADLCAQRPDRFVGLGAVALQHPDLASDQLADAVGRLGLRGVELCTHVEERELADPAFEPFWAKAEELEAVVFLHPMGTTLGARLAPYYLTNVVGNPTDTALALSHLIFSGLLDRHPRLRIVAAHGGGYLPFYSARSDHAWEVRPESHTTLHPPSAYLRRIWFDSLVYTPELLGALVRVAGAGQVVLGTDFPFDMGDYAPLDRLAAVTGLSAADRRAIRGENAARLLKL